MDYAVVEYPLPLLEKGVEIVDSPGLNDTEARNQLTLEYVNNCHAILFVLSATQQFTLGEQRYLDNYIKDRGLTVFFLINAWDEIQNRLVNPEDETELQEAEERVRQVFRTKPGTLLSAGWGGYVRRPHLRNFLPAGPAAAAKKGRMAPWKAPALANLCSP